MNTTVEYNQRQYRRMLDRLLAFEREEVRLGTLVADLEGLLNALEDIEASWKQTFLGKWGQLEDMHAVARDRGSKEFDDDARSKILAATGLLKLLVLDKIDDSLEGRPPA
jgi:hypothetical protein